MTRVIFRSAWVGTRSTAFPNLFPRKIGDAVESVPTIWMSGLLPENVNYAVKSSYLLSFLEVFADGQLKLKEANGKEIKFDEVVEQVKQAAVLVLVY